MCYSFLKIVNFILGIKITKKGHPKWLEIAKTFVIKNYSKIDRKPFDAVFFTLSFIYFVCLKLASFQMRFWNIRSLCIFWSLHYKSKQRQFFHRVNHFPILLEIAKASVNKKSSKLMDIFRMRFKKQYHCVYSGHCITKPNNDNLFIVSRL
jgi:hypothetical protein